MNVENTITINAVQDGQFNIHSVSKENVSNLRIRSNTDGGEIAGGRMFGGDEFTELSRFSPIEMPTKLVTCMYLST